MVEIENTFDYCRQTLTERRDEPAPGRIQILTGPRQVGKTTLLLELAESFGKRAIYAAGDDPHSVPGLTAHRAGGRPAARQFTTWRLFIRGEILIEACNDLSAPSAISTILATSLVQPFYWWPFFAVDAMQNGNWNGAIGTGRNFPREFVAL